MPLKTEARVIGQRHAFEPHIGFSPLDIGMLPQTVQSLRKATALN